MGKILKINKNNRIYKKSAGEFITYLVVFLIFLVLAFSYVYCLFWCFMSGLKTHAQIQLHPFDLPAKLNFANYIQSMSLLKTKDTGFFGMALNSIYFSTVSVFLSLFTTCMLAYVVTFYKFKGAGIFLTITYVTMILPIYGSAGAMYNLIRWFGLINSRAFVLVSLGGIGSNLLFFNAYYKNLSWTYGEAASIDGAGHYAIFFRIMLPQTLPIFGALFLMGWVGAWNDFGSSLIYYPSMPTLATGLFMFQQEVETYGGRSDVFYAGCFLTLLVPLILFAFFNKTLMSNVSLGGIKE